MIITQETLIGLLFIGSIMLIAFLNFLIRFLYFRNKKENVKKLRIWKRIYKNKAKYNAHMSNKKIHKRIKKIDEDNEEAERKAGEQEDKNFKK